MRKTIYPLLLVLLPLSVLKSQSYWESLPGPDGLNIRYLYADGQQYCYAIDYDNQFYRSADKGLHWTLLVPPVPTDFLFYQALNVGYDGTLFYNNAMGEVLISKNRGDSWNVLTHPFVTAGPITALSGGIYMMLTGNGIFRSFDGQTWQLSLALSISTFTTFLDFGRLQNGHAVAVIQSDQISDSGQILVSPDAGLTWDTMPGQAEVAQMVDAGLNRLVFQGSDNKLWLTSPAMTAPQSIPLPFSSTDPYSFVCLSSGRLLVGNFEHNSFSDDFGQNWLPYDGDIRNVLHHSPLPGQVLIKNRSTFLSAFRSVDLGKKWSFSSFGPDKTWAYDWTFKGEDTIFCFASAGLWRSFDRGAHWSIAPIDSCVADVNQLSTYNIALSPEGDLLMLRKGKLMRSVDNGDSFENITPDSALGSFSRIAIHPQTGQYFLSRSGALLRSDDKGVNWTLINESIQPYLGEIVFHPSGTMYTVHSYKLARSDDGGISWQNVMVNIQDNSVEVMEIAPDGTIIAASGNYVYSSEDNGQTWQKKQVPIYVSKIAAGHQGRVVVTEGIGNNRLYTSVNGSSFTVLPAIPDLSSEKGILSVALSPEGYLYTSAENGQFRSAATTGTPGEPAVVADYRVYPNPAHDGFRMDGRMEQPVRVTLRNTIGQVLAQYTGVTAGQYLAIPAGSSGLYWVEIAAPGQAPVFSRLLVVSGF